MRCTIIGGGLAGTEAALVLAEAGVDVVLCEQKPVRRTAAQRTDSLAELVCSNSLRSDDPHNAVGLLHEELRRLGSPVLAQADASRVPAGGALAVDRDEFSAGMTARVAAHPRIERRPGEVTALPEGPEPCIVATGPLTSDALAADLCGAIGAGQLAFYDALAPIVESESVDRSVAFAQSRYGKGDGDDYLNLPLDREQYERFVDELVRGEKVPPREFEQPRYFEGCLPIEVMAERGRDVLAFGPMKPVGLSDPRTGRRPHAVVQLRREDRAGTAWNLVGFQTRLTWPEQRRIFQSCIPGLAGARWQRLGQVHRNTFLQAPKVLAADGTLKARPHIYCAGQIAGVEGYVESAAHGHLTALRVLARLGLGFRPGLEPRPFVPPPGTTALGAILRHLTGEAHPAGAPFEPSNVIFALFLPLEGRCKKDQKKARLLERGRRDLEAWASLGGIPLRPVPVAPPATPEEPV